MPIKINATVVDLRTDQPHQDDVFFVDSNVWYWIGYANASIDSKFNQVDEYPNYVGQALNVGSTLYKCTLSFAELAHSIERSERNIFNPQIAGKDFRHNHAKERRAVIAQIEEAWNLVEGITNGHTVEVAVTTDLIAQSLNRLKVEGLDGYDAFMVEAILSQGIKQVITDDGDFAQVAGITVFTANAPILKQATKQGKLKVR